MTTDLIDRAVADLRPDDASYDRELSRARRNAMVSGILVASSTGQATARPSRRALLWGGVAAGAAGAAGMGWLVTRRLSPLTGAAGSKPVQPSGGPFRHWQVDVVSSSGAPIRRDRYDAADGWSWERVETLRVKPVWYRLHRPERPARLASLDDALAYARSTTPGTRAELASALISVLTDNNPTVAEARAVCDALGSIADSTPQVRGTGGALVASYVVTGRWSDPNAPKEDVTWTVSVDLATGLVQSVSLRMTAGAGYTTTTQIFTMQQVTEVDVDLLTALGSERREWTTER